MTTTIYISVGGYVQKDFVVEKFASLSINPNHSSEEIYAKLLGAIQPLINPIAADFVNNIRIIAVTPDV